MRPVFPRGLVWYDQPMNAPDTKPKSPKNKNPLQGKTLELIVTKLVDHYGWEDLASKIKINCFKSDPSIKSSLTFLRKTPWARKKVEILFLKTREISRD